MTTLKVTWNESGISEEVESELSAAEYKMTRFGIPASEVTVEEVVAVESPAKKTKFAATVATK